LLDVQSELQDRIGENAERLLLSLRHVRRVHEQNKNIKNGPESNFISKPLLSQAERRGRGWERAAR
jgi:hypothetical protein